MLECCSFVLGSCQEVVLSLVGGFYGILSGCQGVASALLEELLGCFFGCQGHARAFVKGFLGCLGLIASVFWVVARELLGNC